MSDVSRRNRRPSPPVRVGRTRPTVDCSVVAVMMLVIVTSGGFVTAYAAFAIISAMVS